MRRPLFVAACVLGALAVSGGCGTSRPPPVFTDYVPDASPDGMATDPSFAFDGSVAPPKCEVVTPDGGICGCTDVPLVTEAPVIYFVLDRSGSMNDSDKWTTVRTVVAKIVSAIGPRAMFGAAVFPNPNFDECTAGVEVMSPRKGDAPAGTAGTTTRMLAAAMNVIASGGTPTAQTLRNLKPRMLATSAKTYVVLATDGGPNCNARVACDVTGCIPNIESATPQCLPNTPPNCCDPANFGPESCLDGTETEAAVADLHASGIDTYVVGVPGSGPYSGILDKLAQAGHTARLVSPYYFRVDTTDEAALMNAMSQIAARIVANCTLPLNGPPPDPGQVNVYIDDKPVPKDPTNGWSLDGATVTLLGTTCDRVMSGSALDVRVIEGCPTVGPR